MQADDSFNDSDEIFNLYSSKKVTETFKAQFEKLISNETHLTTQSSYENCIEDNKNENNGFECFKEEIINLKDQNLNAVGNSANDLISDFLEDSLEIVDSSISERVKRRRNNKGRGNNFFNEPECIILDNDSPVNQTKKKITKKKIKSKKNKKQVDVITLLESPKSSTSLDEDEINPKVSVKVIWKSVNIKIFNIRKFQKFSKIFEELSVEENIPQDKIYLTFNNIKVNPSDTPDSLNLHTYHFLDGGILNEVTNISEVRTKNLKSDIDCVALKFQDMNKRVVNITLNKNEKIKVGMIKYSEQLEIPLEKIKFFVDGELLDPSETPASLGFENDELIDIKICD